MSKNVQILTTESQKNQTFLKMKKSYFSFLLLIMPFFFLSPLGLSGSTDLRNDIRLDRFFGGPLAITDSLYPVKGELAYIGSGTFQSIFMHYQVNSGEVETTFFDDLNLNPQIPFFYEAENPWVPAEEGQYQLKVWFSGLNGAPENEPASDTLHIQVNVHDSLPARQFSLLESFSSQNCGSCVVANTNIRAMIEENEEKFAMIFYHPMAYENSPLYLFNPKDQDIRRDFYQVTYTPFSVIGSLFQGNSEEVNESIMNNEYYKPAGFEIEASYHIEDEMLYSKVKTESFSDFSQETLSLFVVLTEDHVGFEQPPGSNGEKDFYHVMRAFLPNGQGTRLDNQYEGATFSTELSYRLQDTGIDTTGIRLLAFVQDPESLEIYQTTKLVYKVPEDDDDDDNGDDDNGNDNGDDDDSTSINGKPEGSGLNVYPNPSAGIFNIAVSEEVVVNKIRIFDIQGQVVLEQKPGRLPANARHQVDASFLPPGIYVLQLETPLGVHREKITINR